jgi:YbgC/YbaW family acyl-CoA thioester hydrolase
MSKIFTRTFRVRWSELDASGQVSPASYLRYLVETAYDWGDTLGLGAKDEGPLGLFWLIRETEIQFLHPLGHNDVFDFTIWMVNWQRVRGTRCFELKLKDSGTIIAQGTQHIVCMDRKTQRPINPPEEIINNFRLDEPRIFPFERFPKIISPESSFKSERVVEWQDLDALEHVNNAIYLTYAEEAALLEFCTLGWSPTRLAENNLSLVTRRLHIQYLSPAVWGETLTISTHHLSLKQGGGSRYVGITRADGSSVCECILDWQLIDTQTGTELPLPKDLVKQLKG